MTLIHEFRHLMMETNPFLPEDIYPGWLSTEESVEIFARDAYETLPENLKHFL